MTRRKVEINGKTYVIRGCPVRFLRRKSGELNRRKRGLYYLHNNKMLFYDVQVIGKFKVTRL